MKRYFVLGKGIGYSLSPRIFEKLFSLFGDNATYTIKDVDSLGDFESIVSGCDGFNVTKPYKTQIISHLSRDESGIGSVNTVTKDLVGYSTDGEGFLVDLKRCFPSADKSAVLVIGYGGAARACVKALKSSGAQVAITGRNPQKVASFACELGVKVFDQNFSPDGVVSCVTETFVPKLKNKPTFCYDLRYAGETLSLNCPSVGGKGMLITQAVLSYALFTQKQFDKNELESVYLKLRDLI